MKKLWLVAVGFGFAAALSGESGRYGLEVSVRPEGAVYVCEAQVKDLDSGEVVSAPRVVFAGESVRTTTTSGDLLSEIGVSLDAQGSKATVDLAVSCSGMRVAAQRVTVQLQTR